MIVTNRKITIGIDKSTIDEPVVLYRGDYEVEIRFTLDDSKFKFLSGVNVIETDKPSYAQLAILRPDADNIFSDITRCSEGIVSFILTKEMIDQINEVGVYSFHIRLFDYNKSSRVTIPPVEYGIEVREPIASEDHSYLTNKALVDYAITKASSLTIDKVGNTFDNNNNYNKTEWYTGERITKDKLNKVEDAIYKINQNEINNTLSINKKLTSNFNVLNSTKADKQYVDESIVKAQLSGGTVDTSNFVFQSEFTPYKKIIDCISLKYNEFLGEPAECSTIGSIKNLTKSNDGEFLYAEWTLDNNSSNCLEYELPYKIGEIDKFYIDVEFTDSNTCFVGIGSSFYWPNMSRKHPTNGVRTEITINVKDDLASLSNAKARFYIGVTNNNKCRVKYRFRVKLVSENEVMADYANEAIIANDISEDLKVSLLDESFDCVYNNITKIPIGARIPSIDSYTVRDNGSKLTSITSIDSGWVNCKKESTEDGTRYAGVYIRIDYESIDDLDVDFRLDFRINSGLGLTNVLFLYEISDWGYGASQGVSYFNPNKTFNLKEALIQSGLEYEKRNHLYICAVRYGDGALTYDYDYRVIMSNVKKTPVFATNVTSELKEYLENNLTIKKGVGIYIPDISKYTVRTNSSGLTTLTNIGNGWIRCKKESTEDGTRYAGVYIRIDYETIDDLDVDFRLDFNRNEGPSLSSVRFLYDITDWGPGTGGIVFQLNTTFNLKDKLTSVPNVDYTNRTSLYICAVRYNDAVSSTYDYEYRVVMGVKNPPFVYATHISDNVKKEILDEVKNITAPYITCWGDSLTAGGGWTGTLETLSGIPVYNGGTGGEDSRCIMARQGGDIMTINNITIPATTDTITIASRKTDGGIPTQFGYKVSPLLQGGAHVNPCYIGTVKGTLGWTGSSYADTNGTWTFTRSEAGEEVVINRPTAIRTDFDINRNNPKVMIIFIGQNGGYDNNDDLIRQHRLMIEHSDCEDFIVLGLSSGTADSRKDYEAAMLKEFGRRFISLRAYLSQYGMEDAGLEPTEDDKAAMMLGKVPQSLLSDTVHYNSACKTVIGNMLYRKLIDLNML